MTDDYVPPRRLEHAGAHRYDHDQVRSCPVLLVGEDNPQSADSRHALYPYPVGCAGHRLAEDILDIGMAHQLATWRTNLCSPHWNSKQARARARELVVAPGAPWRVIVMLGRKVADAFGHAFADELSDDPIASVSIRWSIEPFETKRVLHGMRTRQGPDGLPRVRLSEDLDWMTLISLPHPSGRNRVWNDPAQVHRARALLAQAAPTWYGEQVVAQAR